MDRGGGIWVAASQDVLALAEKAAPSCVAGTHGESPRTGPGH